MIRRCAPHRAAAAVSCAIGLFVSAATVASAAAWQGFGGDPTHAAQAPAPAQPLQAIHWQAAVDLHPVLDGGILHVHYGSPVITDANTVIFSVKTGNFDGFQIQARDGATGAVKWTIPTDYSVPVASWIPEDGPTLTPSNRLYYPGVGGTLLYRDNPDAPGGGTTGRFAFYGINNYNANPNGFNNTVKIDTPLTSDAQGNVYFGYELSAPSPLGAALTTGVAKVAPDGTGTFISAATLANDSTATKPSINCAPALSADGSKLYIEVKSPTAGANAYLASLNTSNMTSISRVLLRDPANGQLARQPEIGTASPTIGPDGDVYYGVLDGGENNTRGFLLHFSADLSVQKTPGSFGWDDTASLVPASMVPSYHGSSAYLLMTKYNNYAGNGGDGKNKIAILDPNATQTDPNTGIAVMKEVATMLGQTPDPEWITTFPGAVREWCINTAAVDPTTHSIFANSEDGKLYRWDTTTNTFSQVITLTSGLGEAYTPTVIGPDGTVYAINDAKLFAVGVVPEPAAMGLATCGAAALLCRRRLSRG